MKLPVYCSLLILLAALCQCGQAALQGRCSECFQNGGYSIACVDERRFVACFDGVMSNMVTPCPVGNVCADDPQICLPTAEGFTAACYQDNCGTCEVSVGNFACLDEYNYAFCFGGTQPNESSKRACPAGYVCNVKSAEMCTPAASSAPSCVPASTQSPPTTTEPSTVSTTTDDPTTTQSPATTTEPSTVSTTTVDPTTTQSPSTTIDPSTVSTTTDDPTTTQSPATTTEPSTVSTTPEPTTTQGPATTTPNIPTTTQAPRDPDTFCSEVQIWGNHKPDGDTTCKDYIYCYMLAGQYLGLKYVCEGYFNTETASCQKAKPANC